MNGCLGVFKSYVCSRDSKTSGSRSYFVIFTNFAKSKSKFSKLNTRAQMHISIINVFSGSKHRTNNVCRVEYIIVEVMVNIFFDLIMKSVKTMDFDHAPFLSC